MAKITKSALQNATAFYGMSITDEIARSIDEGLTYLNTPDFDLADLVTVHLKSNHSYFGSIDKTLSGFVILNSDGDDYKLLDLRDSGQVYEQWHEERSFSIINKDLASYAGKEETKGKIKSTAKLKPSTQALAERYQWLVWFFSQPSYLHGNKVSTEEKDATSAMNHFLSTFPKPEDQEKLLKKELKLLSGDPHLAIYWLLHTTLLVQPEQRKLVLEKIAQNTAKESRPLLDAFVKTFGDMGPQGELSVLKTFRERWSQFITLYDDGAENSLSRQCLLAIEMSPTTRSNAIAYWVDQGLKENALTDAQVADVVARIKESSGGVEYLRTSLAKRKGEKKSKHADRFAQASAKEENNYGQILDAVCEYYEMCDNPASFVPLVKKIHSEDEYRPRILKVMLGLQKLAGKELFAPDKALSADYDIAMKAIPYVDKMLKKDAQWKTDLDNLKDKELKKIIALRVLQINDKWDKAMLIWAIELNLQSGGNIDAISRKLSSLEQNIRAEILPVCAKTIDSSKHPFVAVLLQALKDVASLKVEGFAAKFALEHYIEALCLPLSPYVKEPQIFAVVMDIINRRDAETLVAETLELFFNSYKEKTYTLPSLSEKQAAQVLESAIRTKIFNPGIYARAEASHVISKFVHPQGAPLVFAALEKYSPMHADGIKELDGEKLVLNKYEETELEDIVQDLYFAAGKIADKEVRRNNLIDWLFKERLYCWRVTDALNDVLTDEKHLEILKLIGKKRSYLAAANYAFLFHQHRKQDKPLVDLLRVIAEWPVSAEPNPLYRQFFKFALSEGIKAAINSYQNVDDIPLMRAAYQNFLSTDDPLTDPDQYRRGKESENPLINDADLVSQLNFIMDGKAASNIVNAAKNGDAKTVQKLANEGCDLNLADKDGWTALHHLAQKGDPETALLLLKKKAKVNAKASGKDKETPLYIAAVTGNAPVLKVLIENKANLDPVNSYKRTALGMASYKNQQKTALMLIEAGADFQKKDGYEQAPLQLAAENGGIEIVKKLIALGAPLNEQTHPEKATALQWAAKYGHVEIVKVLLEAGADPLLENERRQNAIHLAKTPAIKEMITNFKKS